MVRRQEPIDEWVRALVRAYLAKPSSRALLTPPRDDQAARKARAELTALRTRRKSLARLLADGVLDEHEVRVEVRDLDTRIAAASEALADPTVSPTLRRVLGAEDVGAALDALDVDEMRDVIAAVVTVTIKSPGRGARNFDESTVVVEPIHK